MSPVTRRTFAFGAAMILAASAFAAPAAAQDEPPTGGTAVVGEWQAATQLNPYFHNSVKDSEAIAPVGRGLVTVNSDGQWAPEFLTELPSLENGTIVLDEDGDGFTVTLSLLEGLQWSDGTPLTLHDYAWTMDWLTETGKSGIGCTQCATYNPLIDESIEGEARWAPENHYIESITVSEDGLTAEMKYRQNYAGWMGVMASWILPQQFWADIAPEDIPGTAVPGNPVLLDIPVNGPFMVSAASTEGIDYVPNTAWAADTGPYLDQLRLRFYGSKDGEFTAFLNGEIDATMNTTMADVKALQSVDPSIGRAQVDNSWMYEHLDFNQESTHAGLDDPEVRKALGMAIDRQALVDVLFPGAGLTPACSISPPTVWWASEPPCLDYDAEAAAALLDELGWVYDSDAGTRAKDGNAMRIWMCTSSGNPTRLTTLGRIAQDWAAIDVATNIQTEDPTVYFGSWEETTGETDCSITRGTFDVALFTYLLSGDPYGNYYYAYHSTQPATPEFPGGGNYVRMRSDDADAILEEMQTKVDLDEIKVLADEFHQYVAENTVELPLYYRPEPMGVSNRLGGLEKGNPSTATKLWDVENWYIQE